MTNSGLVKQTKILFICNYGLLFGANRSLLTLVEYFNRNPHYLVRVIVPTKQTMYYALKEKRIDVRHYLFFPSFLYLKFMLKHLLLPFTILINTLVLPFLLFRINKFSPDIIYSNTSAENLGIIVAKILGTKHICHIREFMSLDHGAQFIFGNKAKKRYLEMSDGLIFVSESVATNVLMGNNLNSCQKVVYNGIDSNTTTIISKKIPSSVNIGIVGVLQESKGTLKCLAYFEQILKEHPDMVLHIYGDGYTYYKDKIAKFIENASLQGKVVMHGFVADTKQIYKNLDVLLMFSRSEGFGRVTIEAMLSGVPVIGFDNAGTAEIIKHGINGFLFTNYEDFQQSMNVLLRSDDDYNKIRATAFEHAKHRFNPDRYCTEIESHLQYVLHSNPRS